MKFLFDQRRGPHYQAFIEYHHMQEGCLRFTMMKRGITFPALNPSNSDSFNANPSPNILEHWSHLSSYFYDSMCCDHVILVDNMPVLKYNLIVNPIH